MFLANPEITNDITMLAEISLQRMIRCREEEFE
jgi:hypothetical protein